MPSPGEVLLSSVLRSCLSSSLSQDTTVLCGEGAPAPASSKLLTVLSPWIGRLLQESGPDSCLLLPFLTSQEFSSYLASSLQLAFGDKGAWKEVQGVHSVLAGALSPAPEREPPSPATSLAPSPALEQSIVQLKIEPEEDILENINFVKEDVDKEEVNAKESVRDISGHEECSGCGFQLWGRNKRSMMKKHKEKCSSIEGNSPEEIITKKLPVKKKMCDLCGFRSHQKKRWYLHDTRCPPEEWPCDECGLTLDKEIKLKKHSWEEHQKNRCGEGDCDYESPFQGQLSFHRLKEHGGTKPTEFNCDLCTEVYVNKNGLKRHIDKMHEGKRIECEKCNFQALTKTDLQNHLELKHKDSLILSQL